MNRAKRWDGRAALQRLALVLAASALLSAAVVVAEILSGTSSAGAQVSADFTLVDEITDLTRPTAVEVAPNGAVFVAEKDGVLKAFYSLDDTSGIVVADWKTRVMNSGDQGLLGLAVDPLFDNGRNYVYVYYTLDELPGENDPPHWGDTCPLPDGCIVTSTVSRIEVDPSTNAFISSVDLLSGAACLQFVGHSNDDLAVGPDGALYLSTGDGASFVVADYGQLGNPCMDPPYPDEPTAANGEGGAFRTMDLLTSVGGESNDPVSIDGAVLRIDPDTGQAVSDNPLVGIGVAGDDRIIAHGLRNPYRFDFRPGTDELWIGDVGWLGFEELNVIGDIDDAVVENFGWPCYEGPAAQAIFSQYGFCQTLANDPGSLLLSTDLTDPYFSYAHPSTVSGCPGPSSALAGVAFATGGPYPSEYDDALFLADYSRQCLWAMRADTGGVPDPGAIDLLMTGVVAVDLDVTPTGELLLVDPGDFSSGSGVIRRLTFTGQNQPPTADITANTLTGIENETLFEYDGTGSTDPESEPLTYDWDLDGDGTFDATGPTASIVYTEPGTYDVRLRVTDPQGAIDEATVTVNVSNTAPEAIIDAPAPSLTWRVGDEITFSGTGTDAEDGTLAPDTPGQEWEWLLILHHCPDGDCHEHVEGTWSGVAGDSFVAPDHEYPSWLELRLEVVDSTGATGSATVVVQPVTSTITLQTDPTGLLVAGGVSAGAEPSPLSFEAIENGVVSIVAPSPQTSGGVSYAFDSWSDGGAQGHDVAVPTSDLTLVASFMPVATGFADQWTAGTPAPGWSYLWNDNGPIGGSAGYTDLLWNGTTYDADGIPGNPAAGELPYGKIGAGRVHPGRGTGQGAADDRHVIIRYLVPEPGQYDIVGSTIDDADCASSGVEVTVLVNDVVRSTQTHTGSTTGTFDQGLGVLGAGDAIDVAVGPAGSDTCDTTNIDFFFGFTEPVAQNIVATYSADFTPGSPSGGWSYLWNESSDPGQSSGYSPLQWNGVYYDSDGVLAGPSPDELEYGYLASWGGHPGPSASQAPTATRYVVIRYTAVSSGDYDLVDSFLTDRGCTSDDVEIQVRVNDALVSTTTYPDPITGDFDTPLGSLAVGDTIDVLLGPGADDHCDGVDLDFSLAHTPGDPGANVATFSSDFTGSAPSSGWSYLWNEGVIGDSSQYTPLQWNGTQYDSDGLAGGTTQDEFSFGLVAQWGVHPGLGTEQGTAADRYAIVRYTVSSAGSFSVTGSSIADRGCASAGVEIQVRANDSLVLTQDHTGSTPASFDVGVGNLAPGDTIDVAVGPAAINVCDAVDLDFSINQAAAVDPVVVGTFSENVDPGGLSNGWSFLWNESGPIGQPDGYTALVSNGTEFTGDGSSTLPVAGELAFGRVGPWGMHAGRGSLQGVVDERFTIARLTVDSAGAYAITGSTIADLDCPSLGGVELLVLVNDVAVSTLVHTGSTPGSFDGALGQLAAGDTIDVALGPNGADFCDATGIDYTIERS